MNKSVNLIIWFSFIAPLFMFIGIFIYQVGDEYILTTLDNVTSDIGTQVGISNAMQTHISDLPIQYRDLPVNFDLGFLLSFIIVFMATISTSMREKEESWLSFFGTITFGFMVFLFFAGWIVTLTDWFVLNLIENFLGFDVGTTPIFYYWTSTTGLIIFVWYVFVTLLNKLSFSTKRESENDINIPGGNFGK